MSGCGPRERAGPEPARARRGERRRRARGHLLLDYFVGGSVFLVALGSFLAATEQRVRGLGEAERRARACAAASSMLQELRAGRPLPAEPVAVPDLVGGSVVVERAVRADGLADLRIRVRWDEPSRPPRELAITTVMP